MYPSGQPLSRIMTPSFVGGGSDDIKALHKDLQVIVWNMIRRGAGGMDRLRFAGLEGGGLDRLRFAGPEGGDRTDCASQG